MWYSADLCEDARPFCPIHELRLAGDPGENLKRDHPVPSNDLRPLLIADDRRCVMRVETAGKLRGLRFIGVLHIGAQNDVRKTVFRCTASSQEHRVCGTEAMPVMAEQLNEPNMGRAGLVTREMTREQGYFGY